MDLSEKYINGIIKGDEVSFGYFIRYYSSRLFCYAKSIVKTKESAEEVVSNVFFEVWRIRKNLSEIENINSWLYTVTYRKAISYLRKESDKTEISIDEMEDFLIEPMPAPDEVVISKETMSAINLAIQSLPPKCKHVFYLAKIEKLPYKEISEILNISIKTINNHVATALSKIEIYLKEEEGE